MSCPDKYKNFKLNLLLIEINNYDFAYFSHMNQHVKGFNYSRQRDVKWLQNLQEKFEE